MLTLSNITKKYQIGNFKQTALNSVSLSFRDEEFVAVLGPSGSGKTTLLNIVGGLDRYDSGDLLIDGKSTKSFDETRWDSYRNHAVGFVFQNYNLITHSSVLANVEIAMTLSGLSPSERQARALDVLEEVGLKDHIHKKPNQLSGGQMQRVAIARALANDPDIIMADEPTGAIDSTTAEQIMALIKRIAKDKLVIMVTHDEQLAKAHANRIVELTDGKVTNDTNPYDVTPDASSALTFKKTAMAFTQALKLSFSNLRTKKFRTLITAFAGSIGIIGIALVLSLANGLNTEIDNLERTTLAEFPIQIDPQPIDVDALREGPLAAQVEQDQWEEYPDVDEIYPFEETFEFSSHTNTLDSEYLEYLESLDNDLYHEISVERNLRMNVLMQRNDSFNSLDTGDVDFSPTLNDKAFFEENYDMLRGNAPEDKHDLMLVVDQYNRIDIDMINTLGLDGDRDAIDFDEIMALEFAVPMLDDYYVFDEESELYQTNDDFEALWDNENTINLNISGIARIKDDAPGTYLSEGLKHHPELSDVYLEDAADSQIGQDQKDSDTSVRTGLNISESNRRNILQRWGVDDTPSQILIYPTSFSDKEGIIDHLDAYNEDRDEEDHIIYTDLASLITELTGDVIDGISYVLIAFSAISLIVSSIMIGIITYISVLERTKEIGILRSLGARKRDIGRVFNAETAIIGFISGLLGVVIAFILTFPINAIIGRIIEDIDRIAILPFIAASFLVVIAIMLTLIAGLIPARMAANKDPVTALRVD